MPDQSPKRGAIASPRHALAAAAPYAPLIGAPLNLIIKPQQISMWGNDVHGDCVTAEEAFAKACNNPEIFISDNEVIAWATRHGVLEGAYLTQVMTWMQNDGFAEGSLVYDDGPYLSVNWTDAGILQSAISRGPVKIGVAADQIEAAWHTTGGQSGWFGTGFHTEPPANEDHCVSLCGYGSLSWLAQQLGAQVPAGVDGTKPGYAMFTWNSIGIIDAPSMTAVTFEAWLRQPTTVTKLNRNLWHTMRQSDGSWTGLGDVNGQFAIPGAVAAVSACGDGVSGQTQFMFTTTDGHLWHTMRQPDGSWTGLGDVNGQFAIPGAVAAVSACGDEMKGETQFMFTTK
jgi:hypothetical protein